MYLNRTHALLVIFLVIFIADAASAGLFYGATVADREVPTVAWRAGVTGIRVIVTEVPVDAVAGEVGLKRGDVILSINGKEVQHCADLKMVAGDSLSVELLEGDKRKKVVIEKSAVANHKPMSSFIKTDPGPVRRRASNPYAPYSPDSRLTSPYPFPYSSTLSPSDPNPSDPDVSETDPSFMGRYFGYDE